MVFYWLLLLPALGLTLTLLYVAEMSNVSGF